MENANKIDISKPPMLGEEWVAFPNDKLTDWNCVKIVTVSGITCGCFDQTNSVIHCGSHTHVCGLSPKECRIIYINALNGYKSFMLTNKDN